MARRCWIAGLFVFLLTPLAHAVITAPAELAAFLAVSDYIVVVKVDSLDGDKGQIVFSVKDDLKGKFEFRRLPTAIQPDQDAVQQNHVPQLLKRLKVELPIVLLISRDEKELKALAFTNGTWMQLLGKQTEKDRVVWVLTHGEPLLRKTFKGTTDEMIGVIKGIVNKKEKAPKLDPNVAPGFGPEARNHFPGFDPFHNGPALFGVIPTLGVAAPLAILAILFPTMFGGVLILFRQWTAFITMLSINSTLYLLYWWKGEVWLGESWWGSNLGVWTVFTAVTLTCTLWAWRRQLANLSQGADCLETPSRTEFLVLGVLTLTCLGFIAGTWILARPSPTDLVWNLTLVLAAGIVVGLLYKSYRGIFEVMLPMATEGVMLGVASLASLAVFVFLARLQTGTAAAPLAVSGTSTDSAGPQFKGERWTFESKRPGLFASSPLIDGNQVYAASSHPPFGWGYLYRLDLDTGTEQWKFGGGTYRRPVSSPVLSDGRVYIGEGWHGDPECKAYCVNASDGQKVWEFPTANQTEATPAIEGDKVYIGCGNDGFRCLTADENGKGSEVWRFPPKSDKGPLLRFAAGAKVAAGKVYVGTAVDRDLDGQGETALFCLDAVTGKQIWKTPMPLPVWTTPIVSRGQLILAIGNGDVFNDDKTKPAGAVYCLNPETGDVVWKIDLPNSVLQEPSYDKHRLYLGCRDGGCYALDRKNGEILWKVNLGAPVVGTPAIAWSAPKARTSAVYAVSNAGRVVCLDPESGLLYWKTTSFENRELVFITAPAVAVRPVDGGGEERLIVIGAGNAAVETGKLATLICLEDRVPAEVTVGGP